jgi:hypothetical protein
MKNGSKVAMLKKNTEMRAGTSEAVRSRPHDALFSQRPDLSSILNAGDSPLGYAVRTLDCRIPATRAAAAAASPWGLPHEESR